VLGGAEIVSMLGMGGVMFWPNVGVIIPTYNRADIVCETIKLLCTCLHYNGIITFYVGVDGDDDTRDRLEEMQDSWLFASHDKYKMVVLDGPRRKTGKGSLGANLNMLLRRSEEDIVIQMDDDHHLLEPLVLYRYVAYLMDNNPVAGWIRLYGIANHHLTATLKGSYWYVHWDSSGDYSLYIPNNRPHIKHSRFHEFFGMYPEGLTLGETEEGFCHQCRDVITKHCGVLDYETTMSENVPHVLIPLNLYPNSESGWAHVGESWQQKGE